MIVFNYTDFNLEHLESALVYVYKQEIGFLEHLSNKIILTHRDLDRDRDRLLKNGQILKNNSDECSWSIHLKTGLFHPKLYILRTSTFVRVIISSMNLDQTSRNVFSVLDFPINKSVDCVFKTQLNQFIWSYATLTHNYDFKVCLERLDILRDVDFSGTNARLITNLNDFKFNIKSLNMKPFNRKSDVFYIITNNIGLNILDAIEDCLQVGESDLQIVYPDSESNCSSIMGYYDDPDYVPEYLRRPVFKDSLSTDDYHYKIYCRINGDNTGFTMVGSHNLSQSAWFKNVELSCFEPEPITIPFDILKYKNGQKPFTNRKRRRV